ncbi:MAG: hypothetical protein II392_01520 [Mycoplasma sp.]|nr:hypothetical protein [Mycoplasma sp.]
MLVDLKVIKLSKVDKQKLAFSIKRKHNFKSITYFLAWSGFLLGLVTCAIEISNTLLPEYRLLSVYDDVGYKLFFEFFAFFTQQSNIIVIITYFLFLTLYKTRIFNNRNIVLAAGIYINLTMFTYWIIMMSQWVLHQLDTYVWWSVFASLSFHLFCPVIYDFFLFTNVNYPYKKIKNPLNRLHSSSFIPILLIYPLLYMLFAIIINFIKLPPEIFRTDIKNISGELIYNDLANNHPFASIYNAITCFNSRCWIIHIGLGNNPNEACFDDTSSGNIFYILVSMPIALIFMLNIIWIVSINNHYTTPKSMMLSVIKEWKLNEIQNANIYSKYLNDFSEELKNNSQYKKNKKYAKK